VDPKTFVLGVVSGAIGSILAVWFVSLLKRPAQAVWARMNAPGPLTLEQKVKIASQITQTQQTLDRLNHMEAHPKDLYLYLFQLVMAIFMCAGTAALLYVIAPTKSLVVRYNDKGDPVVEPFILLALMLVGLGFVFLFAATWEARRMSAKNIDTTRATVEKTLADLKEKLGMPLV
jgi:hypothetical protein